MRVALINVDGHNFPSLPLMKISAWHKKQGDSVEWYDPLTAWKQPPDRVYMSKVFTFTPDYTHPVNAAEIIKGGTGYNYPNGKPDLPPEIEHIYPDYSLFPALCKDTALDTHVGSASSLIACRNTGHKFVGFELSEHYFKLSQERYRQETAQMRLIDFMGGGSGKTAETC